jgi:AraC-like DNA-binding protein
MEAINIPEITEEDILEQNRLTPVLSKQVPEIIIRNYSINLLEVHWVVVSLQREFHSHRFFEIHVPFQGQGKILTPHKQSFFKPGFFTITPPKQPHAWECIVPPLQMQVWWLTIRPLRKVSAQLQSPEGLSIRNLASADDLIYPLHPFFFTAFPRMLEEAASPQAGSEIILKSLFNQVIILLARAVKPLPIIGSSPAGSKADKLSDRILLSRVDEFIQSNLQHELSLDEIAGHLEMSPRTLTRRYRQTKSQTIWQTITQMRMTKAKSLLQTSSLAIHEVAERCGIYDKHYFSAKFKKHFGSSPAAFIKTMKLRRDND